MNTPKASKRLRVRPPVSMDPVMLQRIDSYLERSVPEKHKMATERALKGQMGKATALKMKCLQCCNYQRVEVAECRVVICALHKVRPYQPGEPVEDDEDLPPAEE